MTPTPTSLELGGWMLCLFCVLAGLNQLFKFLDRFKSKDPVPPLVQQFAAVPEVKDLKSRLLALEAREAQCKQALAEQYASKTELDRLERERHEWRAEVNEKLDELLQRTAHLVGYGNGGKS